LRWSNQGSSRLPVTVKAATSSFVAAVRGLSTRNLVNCFVARVQLALVFAALPLLKDDLLDPVDQLLEDPAWLDLVQQCLAARSPASARTGRPGITPDRVLRCCIMKHLKGWSFRDLERELRSNLVYRRFTRLVESAGHRTNSSAGGEPGA
jgi:hypothetical protein